MDKETAHALEQMHRAIKKGKKVTVAGMSIVTLEGMPDDTILVVDTHQPDNIKSVGVITDIGKH